MVALVAVTLPMTVPGAAGALMTAGVVSTVATAGHGLIECTDGGSGGACATDAIGAGLAGGAAILPTTALKLASNGYGRDRVHRWWKRRRLCHRCDRCGPGNGFAYQAIVTAEYCE